MGDPISHASESTGCDIFEDEDDDDDDDDDVKKSPSADPDVESEFEDGKLKKRRDP